MKTYYIFVVCLLLSVVSIVRSQIIFEEYGSTIEQIGHYPSLKWGDIDNDGDVDLIISGGTDDAITAVTKIYLNNDGILTELPTNLPGISHGGIDLGDLDNDGDLDIAITGIPSGATNGYLTKIFRNDNLMFVDLNADIVQLRLGTVKWADYDNDGDLDLLVTGQAENGRYTLLYKNINGVFGVDQNTIFTPVGLNMNHGAAWGDYDNDGDLDLIITGGAGNPIFSTKLYTNNNGLFTFTDSSFAQVYSGSAQWGDFDGDGKLDLLISGYIEQSPYYTSVTKVYKNINNSFVEFASLTGVGDGTSHWADFDNDDDLDIILCGNLSNSNIVRIAKVFQNDNCVFNEISSVLTGVHTGNIAIGDFDNDGRKDLILAGNGNSSFVTKLYRNVTFINNKTLITIDDMFAYQLDTVTISVFTKFSLTKNYSSAQINLNGFKNNLQFLGIDTTETLAGTSGWSYQINPSDSAVLMAFAGSQTINGEGVLCKLKFKVVGNSCTFAPLNIAYAKFDTGLDSVTTINGGVHIKAVPTFGDVDLNGRIEAFDASRILRHIVGTETLTDCQKLANADVTNDGTVSALDATGILKFVVQLINTFPFTPSAQPEGNVFLAGNYNNGIIEIPVKIEKAVDVLSYEAVITFDQSLLSFTDSVWPSEFTRDLRVEGNTIRIAAARSVPGNSQEQFVVLRFHPKQTFTQTTISLKQLRLNESKLQSDVQV